MPEEERLASMHIVDTNGRVHSAGAAVIILLSLNKKTRWMARMASRFHYGGVNRCTRR